MKMYELKNYMNLNLGNANAILKAGPKNTIEQNGVYKGALASLKRTDAERAENNRAREQLLCALAKAFGGLGKYSGVRNGQRGFDEIFLDKLEEVLGKDFKRADFAFKNGVVTSGKPLTQRRVTAIIGKMVELANKSDNPGWEKADVAKEKRPAGLRLGLKIKSNLPDDGSASLSDIAADAKKLRQRVHMNEAARNAFAGKEDALNRVAKSTRNLTEDKKEVNEENDLEIAQRHQARKAGKKPAPAKTIKTFIKDVNKQTDERFTVSHGAKTAANQAKTGLSAKEQDTLIEQEVQRDNLRFAARRDEKIQVIGKVAVSQAQIINEVNEADEFDEEEPVEIAQPEDIRDNPEVGSLNIASDDDAVTEALLQEIEEMRKEGK